MQWSSWSTIEEAAKRNGSFEDYGIYQVRIVNFEGDPRTVQRLVGADPSGLVYVGRSGLRATGNGRTVANRAKPPDTLNRGEGKRVREVSTKT